MIQSVIITTSNESAQTREYAKQLEELWLTECTRRVAEYEAGETTVSPMEEVLEELLARRAIRRRQA